RADFCQVARGRSDAQTHLVGSLSAFGGSSKSLIGRILASASAPTRVATPVASDQRTGRQQPVNCGSRLRRDTLVPGVTQLSMVDLDRFASAYPDFASLRQSGEAPNHAGIEQDSSRFTCWQR